MGGDQHPREASRRQETDPAPGPRLPVGYLLTYLANSGLQELPDLLGGLGCLGGAEHERVDVG